MRYLIAGEGYDPKALRRFLCKTGATPVIQNDVAGLPGTVRAQVSGLNSVMYIPAMVDQPGSNWALVDSHPYTIETTQIVAFCSPVTL